MTNAGSPVFQPTRCPLLMVPVAFRHVLCDRAVSCVEGPLVSGYHLASRPDLRQAVEGMQLHCVANILMGSRVMMLLILDVVIDIHLRFFNMPVAPDRSFP